MKCLSASRRLLGRQANNIGEGDIRHRFVKLPLTRLLLLLDRGNNRFQRRATGLAALQLR